MATTITATRLTYKRLYVLIEYVQSVRSHCHAESGG